MGGPSGCGAAWGHGGGEPQELEPPRCLSCLFLKSSKLRAKNGRRSLVAQFTKKQ